MNRLDIREGPTPMSHAEASPESGRFGFTERQAAVSRHGDASRRRLPRPPGTARSRVSNTGRAGATIFQDAGGAADSPRRRPVLTVAPDCFTSTTSPSTPPSVNPTTGSAGR